MIISNAQVQNILKLQMGSYKKRNNIDEVSNVKADSLALSSRAQELKATKEMVLKSPDVNADKVTELKKQIQEGTYQVSGADIASKMVNRSLVDELARR